MDEAIPSKQVTTDPDEVQDVLRNWTKSKNIWVVSHPQRKGALVAHVAKDVDPLKLIKTATEKLHRYEVPTHICEVSNPKLVSTRQLIKIIPKPREAVASILSGGGGGSGNGTAGGGDPMIAQVQDVFLELLGLDYIPAPDADFFQIGGSSMTASQLASKIRKTFDIPFAGAEVFHHSTSLNLVELIKSRMDDAAKDDEPKPKGSSLNRRFHLASFEPSRMQPSNTVLSALVQLVPMFFLFPAWQISRYLLFFATLMNHWRMFPGTSDRSFSTFLVAYAIFHILWVTLAPLVSSFLWGHRRQGGKMLPRLTHGLEKSGQHIGLTLTILSFFLPVSSMFRFLSQLSGSLSASTRPGGTRSGDSTTSDGGLLISVGSYFCVVSGALPI